MNNIFSNLFDVCVVIHFDNILIYSNNMFIYYWNIIRILKYPYKTGLYTKVKKYKFYSKLVEYLKYIFLFLDLLYQITKLRFAKPKKDWMFLTFFSFS